MAENEGKTVKNVELSVVGTGYTEFDCEEKWEQQPNEAESSSKIERFHDKEALERTRTAGEREKLAPSPMDTHRGGFYVNEGYTRKRKYDELDDSDLLDLERASTSGVKKATARYLTASFDVQPIETEIEPTRMVGQPPTKRLSADDITSQRKPKTKFTSEKYIVNEEKESVPEYSDKPHAKFTLLHLFLENILSEAHSQETPIYSHSIESDRKQGGEMMTGTVVPKPFNASSDTEFKSTTKITLGQYLEEQNTARVVLQSALPQSDLLKKLDDSIAAFNSEVTKEIIAFHIACILKKESLMDKCSTSQFEKQHPILKFSGSKRLWVKLMALMPLIWQNIQQRKPDEPVFLQACWVVEVIDKKIWSIFCSPVGFGRFCLNICQRDPTNSMILSVGKVKEALKVEKIDHLSAPVFGSGNFPTSSKTNTVLGQQWQDMNSHVPSPMRTQSEHSYNNTEPTNLLNQPYDDDQDVVFVIEAACNEPHTEHFANVVPSSLSIQKYTLGEYIANEKHKRVPTFPAFVGDDFDGTMKVQTELMQSAIEKEVASFQTAIRLDMEECSRSGKQTPTKPAFSITDNMRNPLSNFMPFIWQEIHINLGFTEPTAAKCGEIAAMLLQIYVLPSFNGEITLGRLCLKICRNSPENYMILQAPKVKQELETESLDYVSATLVRKEK